MAPECFSEAENPMLKLRSELKLLQQDITDSMSELTEHQVWRNKKKLYHILIYSEKRKILSHFSQKTLKILSYKIIKIAIKISIFYWKNYGHDFSSLFPTNFCHFSKGNVLKTFWDFEKSSKIAKIWLKTFGRHFLVL